MFLIFGVIAVLSLSGYYIFKQNTNSPSSITTADAFDNWKTYKNETLGFEIQYPPSLEVSDNTVEMQNYYVELDKICLLNGGCGGGPRASWNIDFISASNKQEITAAKIIFPKRPNQLEVSIYQKITLDMLYGVKAPKGEEQFLTDYNFDGNMGLRNVQKGFPLYDQGPSLNYGVDYKGKTFTFTFPNKTSSVQDLEYAEKIMSTFKFTTSDWTVYTNKTFGYNIKFPTTYEVPAQTEKEKSQLGIDYNISVKKKLDQTGTSVIVIDVTKDDRPDKDNMSFPDYMDRNLRMYGVTGPLVSFNFNEYPALFNKNQPGINVFVRHGNYIYHIIAPTATLDKEIEDIVSTFKFDVL